MTAPRHILPNSSWLLTRRTSERRFFLRPEKVVNQTFLYALALAAERFDVRVHAAVVMSNHWHAVVTDPRCNLPKFAHLINTMVARAINGLRGRWEGFWASGRSYSGVRLETTTDVIDKVLYAIVNPVRAGLVPKSSEWPGLLLNPLVETEVEVERPEHFFRKKSKLPERITLRLAPVQGALSRDIIELEQRLKRKEAEIRREFRREGKKFLGADRVLKQKWYNKPKTAERRRRLDPCIACSDPELRIVALMRYTAFLQAYSLARDAWIRGKRRVFFPAGTYQMRVRFRVCCHAQAP